MTATQEFDRLAQIANGNLCTQFGYETVQRMITAYNLILSQSEVDERAPTLKFLEMAMQDASPARRLRM